MGSISVVCSNDKASFYNVGKNQNGLCLTADNLGRRIAGIKTAQGRFCALANLGYGGGPASVLGSKVVAPRAKTMVVKEVTALME